MRRLAVIRAESEFVMVATVEALMTSRRDDNYLDTLI